MVQYSKSFKYKFDSNFKTNIKHVQVKQQLHLFAISFDDDTIYLAFCFYQVIQVIQLFGLIIFLQNTVPSHLRCHQG